MFFDFKSRGTFTNRLSKKEKLCSKKRNYIKKKKNPLGLGVLAEEMTFFCARIPKYCSKTAFQAQNSNPCRKISRFFCKDCCIMALGVRYMLSLDR